MVPTPLKYDCNNIKKKVPCSQKTPRLHYKDQSVYPLDNSRPTATAVTCFTVKKTGISPTKCAYLLNVSVRMKKKLQFPEQHQATPDCNDDAMFF